MSCQTTYEEEARRHMDRSYFGTGTRNDGLAGGNVKVR